VGDATRWYRLRKKISEGSQRIIPKKVKNVGKLMGAPSGDQGSTSVEGVYRKVGNRNQFRETVGKVAESVQSPSLENTRTPGKKKRKARAWGGLVALQGQQ